MRHIVDTLYTAADGWRLTPPHTRHPAYHSVVPILIRTIMHKTDREPGPRHVLSRSALPAVLLLTRHQAGSMGASA